MSLGLPRPTTQEEEENDLFHNSVLEEECECVVEFPELRETARSAEGDGKSPHFLDDGVFPARQRCRNIIFLNHVQMYTWCIQQAILKQFNSCKRVS